jgi:hypothetical protein
MSKNNGSGTRVLQKRPPRTSQALVDYKAFCRYVWIRRQKGKRKHDRADK